MNYNTKYEILTPEGFRDFKGIQKVVKDSYLHITFDNGEDIDCSHNHRFKGEYEWVLADSLKEGDCISCSGNHQARIISIYHINENINLYDPIDVEGDNSYYSGGVISHNCNFLGSAGSLLSATVMSRMVHQTPLYIKEDYLTMYYPPEIGHNYVITVDPSEGLGLDYSVATVTDVTEIPYQQCAVYRNNSIDPHIFPDVIYNLANKYNEAFVLVEANNIGAVVCNILHHTLEYENLIQTANKGRSGQIVSGGFGLDTIVGVKTTPATKRIGCAICKSLIESDQYIVNDFNTIKEFTTFVRHLNTFQAEEGYNDDICMTVVLFSWLINNQYFKDMLENNDIRKKLMEGSELRHLEEALVPFGAIDNGLPEISDDSSPKHLRDGAVWENSPLVW